MQYDFHKQIAQFPLFSGIGETEKSALLKEGKLRHYASKKMLFAQGDRVAHFCIILEGKIQLFRTTRDGQEKTVHLLKSGQTLSESELLSECDTHRTNAVAIENVTLLEFPAAWLKQTARLQEEFALNLLSRVAQQIHLAEVEAEQQATMSAAQLVACFLQRLCVLHDLNPAEFELPYSKTLIASRLGMEPETFSRTLTSLKKNGIQVQGNQVHIDNLAQLNRYACDSCSVSAECTTP